MQLRSGFNADIMQNNINKKRKNEEQHEEAETVVSKKLKLETPKKRQLKRKAILKNGKKRELKPKPEQYKTSNPRNLEKKEQKEKLQKQKKPEMIIHLNMNPIIDIAKERFHVYLNTINFDESTYLLTVQGEIYEFLYCSYIKYNEDMALDKILSIECKLNHITGFLPMLPMPPMLQMPPMPPMLQMPQMLQMSK